MDERIELLIVIFGLFIYILIFDRRGFATVVYGCSLFGFSLLRESLVTGQSCNLLLCLAWRSKSIGTSQFWVCSEKYNETEYILVGPT